MTTNTVAGHVIFDFIAEGFPEVSVSEGERVDVHYAPKGSPWIYVHTKNGRKGYIPVNYFEEDDEIDATATGLSEEEVDVHPHVSRFDSVNESSHRSAPTTHDVSRNIGTNSISSFTSSSIRSINPPPYGYITDAQSRASRDAAVTALAATAAAAATQDARNKYRHQQERDLGNPPPLSYHHQPQPQPLQSGSRDIPEQILQQVSGHSMNQCVLVTFHREFVPQISSLLGYFGSQFGVVLNRMKIRYDEVRPYTIAVFAHEDVAEHVLEQTEHLVHDKSRVTKPIRIRVFPLWDYGRVFS